MIHLEARIERLDACWLDVAAAMRAHSRDVQYPLDPRWDGYFRAEREGALFVVTLREHGTFAGYCSVIVTQDPHEAGTLTGITDGFWIDPRYRGRMGGVRMFRAVEAELKRRGVTRWLGTSRLCCDSSRLFQALGFEAVELLFEKRLESAGE